MTKWQWQHVKVVKDTHRENTPWNKTQALSKKYEIGYLGNWYIKSTFIRGFFTQIKFSRKK